MVRRKFEELSGYEKISDSKNCFNQILDLIEKQMKTHDERICLAGLSGAYPQIIALVCCKMKDDKEKFIKMLLEEAEYTVHDILVKVKAKKKKSIPD